MLNLEINLLSTSASSDVKYKKDGSLDGRCRLAKRLARERAEMVPEPKSEVKKPESMKPALAPGHKLHAVQYDVKYKKDGSHAVQYDVKYRKDGSLDGRCRLAKRLARERAEMVPGPKPEVKAENTKPAFSPGHRGCML
jgi:hypothetical protein